MAILLLSNLVDRMRRAIRRSARGWAPSPQIHPEILAPPWDLRTESVGDHGAPWGSGPFEGHDRSRLDSRMCTAADVRSPEFRQWMDRLGERFRYHRKLWEFCFICQALHERNLLRPGSRGLGFAVGQEPLPSLFAAMGCEITATDLHGADSRAQHWKSAGQWSPGLEALNTRGLCPADTFRRRVCFRPVDMNRIPDDLTGYDFTWSSCSFEHCGDLKSGMQFLTRQMECLRPGGIAVHTTEINLTSNDRTLERGATVIYRRRDIEAMASDLRAAGHHVEPLNLTLGDDELDQYVDTRPYSSDRHLRLELGDWVTTSIGLIIRHR